LANRWSECESKENIGNDNIMKSPTLKEWKALYQAAIQFKKLAPWNWMFDSDMFGVQNPETDEIGYCCIMGAAGEHFALAVYLGTEGLDGYLRLQSGDYSEDLFEALYFQKCLMVSFENRKLLEEQDLAVIKKLGLQFRGRKSWPLFRDYSPGYYPWFITSDQARYLTLVLQQAVDIAQRFEDDPERLTDPLGIRYLVRIPKKKKNGLEWTEEWLEPAPYKETGTEVFSIDAAQWEKIKQFSMAEENWEVDFFYFPQGIREGQERPYYPYIMLWVEHYSGFILHSSMVKVEQYESVFIEQCLKAFENAGYLPEEISVKKEEIFWLLEPVLSELGIRLRKTERLISMEKAQEGIYEFYQNGFFGN